MAKTVFLSGGTSGIGKETLRQFLEVGYNVATFSTNEEKCTVLADELASTYSVDRILVSHGDVTDQDDVTRIVAETVEKFGAIDILVNNAGFGYFRTIEEADMDRVMEMLRVNIFGVMVLTQAVVPHLKERGEGQIINLISISGKRVMPQGEFYSASKFGANGYTEGIRKELAEFGIKVGAVYPGMVDTNFFEPSDLERRTAANGGVRPPMLEPEDVARGILFIAEQPKRSNIDELVIMPFSGQ